MSGMECKTCLYYVSFGGDNSGMCHRHPAEVPKVPTDWCGDYRVDARKVGKVRNGEPNNDD